MNMLWLIVVAVVVGIPVIIAVVKNAGSSAGAHPASATQRPTRPAGNRSAGHCERCGKKTLRSGAFFSKAEAAGFRVDRATGQASAKAGGFSMVGSMLDASAALDNQRSSNQARFDELDSQRGYRCKGKGHIYCSDCLFEHAPAHRSGGKACPKCGATFGFYD